MSAKRGKNKEFFVRINRAIAFSRQEPSENHFEIVYSGMKGETGDFGPRDDSARSERRPRKGPGKLKALQLLATLVRSAEERRIEVASVASVGGTKINLFSADIYKATGLWLAKRTWLAMRDVLRVETRSSVDHLCDRGLGYGDGLAFGVFDNDHRFLQRSLKGRRSRPTLVSH